jgi:hypothetical protein
MEDLEEARKKATTAKERIQSLPETEKRVYSEEIDKILKGIDEAMEDKRYNASRAKRPRVEGGRRGGSDPTIPLEQVKRDITALMREGTEDVHNKRLHDAENKFKTAKERLQRLPQGPAKVAYLQVIDGILNTIDKAFDAKEDGPLTKRRKTEGGRRKRHTRRRRHRKGGAEPLSQDQIVEMWTEAKQKHTLATNVGYHAVGDESAGDIDEEEPTLENALELQKQAVELGRRVRNAILSLPETEQTSVLSRLFGEDSTMGSIEYELEGWQTEIEGTEAQILREGNPMGVENENSGNSGNPEDPMNVEGGRRKRRRTRRTRRTRKHR